MSKVQPRIVIVGAGLGGIVTAIELTRYGFEDVVLLERAPDLGGTWFWNTYPGAACDVPSHLYSFSFAQRSDWSRLCSPQPEILSYVHEVAERHSITPRVQTNTDVTDCRFDDATNTWTVTAADGRTWTADAIVLATGQLHQPAYPNIPGADTYTGHTFHSARWDHDYDLRGKRVGVVGTGASAVQFVPEIAPQVAHLTVFQRTGNWFLPRRNRPYPGPLKQLFEHSPAVQRFRRRYIYNYAESLTMMIRHPHSVGRIGRLYSTLFMRRQLKDPEVRRKAWPDYPFGCKRILFSSYYLPALQRPNVSLVTDRIERMSPGGIVTADGTDHPLDCVIYGTGFKTVDFMFPMEIAGREGLDLRDVWAGGPHAYRGICVPGFPSMFIVYGPNTNTSGGSIIAYEEAQARYIRQAMEQVRARDAAAIDVRAEIEAEYDREVQANFDGTAWMTCESWYRNAEGRIVTNWPLYMRDYESSVEHLDPTEFSFLK
jgi:cation diffusion facilitator CzcD-associated flavoprotein CzcO